MRHIIMITREMTDDREIMVELPHSHLMDLTTLAMIQFQTEWDEAVKSCGFIDYSMKILSKPIDLNDNTEQYYFLIEVTDKIKAVKPNLSKLMADFQKLYGNGGLAGSFFLVGNRPCCTKRLKSN